MNMDEIMDLLSKYWEEYEVELIILNIAAALAVFIIGRIIAKGIVAGIRKLMTMRNLDPAITSFACNVLNVALLVVVLITAADQLGVETTSFVAVVGASTLAIGLALQGSLANFAAGFLLILFRRFSVGDYIDAGGAAGIVLELNIFDTKLRSPDNKIVYIPNGQIISGVITNYTAMDSRRMDLVVGVSYDDDLKKVKRVLESILTADERILKDPAPMVGVLEMADSSVNFAVRPWVKTSQYWDVFFDLQMAIKLELDNEGITIPFPQRDVHLFEEKTAS